MAYTRAALLAAWVEATECLCARLEQNDYAAVPALLAARDAIKREYPTAMEIGAVEADLVGKIMALEQTAERLLLIKRDALRRALVATNHRRLYQRYDGQAPLHNIVDVLK